MKDPYTVLGVSKTATQDEIKTAYRNLAKKLHPDLNPGNKSAEEKFKDIATAYERIGTAEARGKFDRGETEAQQQEQARRYANTQDGRGPFYHETQQGGGRYSSAFGEEFGGDEFFENLFRAAGQGRASGRPGARGMRGEDHLYQMEIEFRDAVRGAEREIALATGKKLQIKIPPGVETGARLRFKGQGGLGSGATAAGDATIEITVKPLAGFIRVGNDIETELPISFFEALLGAEVKVPTLDGLVMLKVPPGVSTGNRLRVRGKGVAMPSAVGDQIVVLKVMMPKKVEPEFEVAVREWSARYSYNPREVS